MSFRPATIADEDFFFGWRRAAENVAREQGWWNGTDTTKGEHHEWFVERLKTATLLVWLDLGVDAGLARIESNGEIQFECSEANEGRLLADLITYVGPYRRFKMTIDYDDPKWDALEHAGFREYPARAYVYRP